MRRTHVVTGSNVAAHNCYDDDPDAIPVCWCNPTVTECSDGVVITHNPLPGGHAPT